MKLTSLMVRTLALVLLATSVAEARIESVGANNATGSSKAVVVDAVPLAHTVQALPIDKNGEVVGVGDVSKQAEQVLSNLDAMLKRAKSGLKETVKLNIYVKNGGLSEAVTSVLASEFKGSNLPAVTFVGGDMLHPDVLVSMDAVAVSRVEPRGSSPVHFTAADSRFSDVSVLPAEGVVYVAGLAAKNDLASATRETMHKIKDAIAHLDLKPQDIVQLKAFLLPMSDARLVKEEIGRFFGDQDVPAIVLVDWTSSSVPVEIEAIVAVPSSRSGSTVTYHTPSGIKASPVYSRLARVHSGRRIYTSGLYYGGSAGQEDDVKEIYAELDQLLEVTGSSRDHIAKATYYYSDPKSNARLDAFRPTYYNPQTPPTASKARVKDVGRPMKGIVIDFIAVTK